MAAFLQSIFKMDNQDNTTDIATTATEIATTVQLPMTDDNGNPTAAQVEAWKAKHGKLKCYIVDGKQVYFKQPGRQLVNAANTALATTRNLANYQETILKNTQLNYVQETADNDELYFALAGKVDEIITTLVATLKN